MEVNIGTYSDKEVNSTTTQKDFKLAKGAQTMIFQIFSKKIYSNPIGSVVREITSNCLDSHTEAKVNKPVLIRKTENDETGECYISFIDFGVGMSPDRIDNVFTTFFESTKRENNTQIGGFGLGSKTPLTYRRYINKYNSVGEYDNSYQIITNYDGKKYTYVIHEGKSAPQITLMDSQPTKECNGTEVRIPVLQDDISTFEKEIINQLYYFENVVFEGFEDNYRIKNKYTIYEGENFFFRGQDVNQFMHVSLGRVAYPIDYGIIDEDRATCRVPIALKFDVGELEVVVSREHLDYTPETVKRIKAKIKLAKEELKKRLEADLQNIITLEDFLKLKFDFYQITIGEEKIDLGCYLKGTGVTMSNFPYPFFNKQHHTSIFNFLIENKMYGAKEPTSYYSGDEVYRNSLDVLKNHNNVYYHEGEFNRVVKKQSYLKSQHKRYYILTKAELSELNIANIKQILSAVVDNKTLTILEKLQDEWFEIIKKYAKNYEEIELPEGFGLKGKMYDSNFLNVTQPVGFVTGHHVNRQRVKIKDLVKYKQRKFYGFSEDRNMLLNASQATNTAFDLDTAYGSHASIKTKCIFFFLISKGNEKYFKSLPNTHHISDFKRIILNRKVEDFINQKTYNRCNNRVNEIWEVFKSPRFLEKHANTYGKYMDFVRRFLSLVKPNINDRYGVSSVALNFGIKTERELKSWEEKLNEYYLTQLEKLNENNKGFIDFVNVPWKFHDNEEFWKFIDKNVALK
jgi:hypothetical protein